MKVVVTGGAGFIGSHLTELLVRENYGVIVIDDLSTGSINNIENLLDKIVFVNESILNMDKLADYFKEAELVIHLAAISSVEESTRNPIRVYQVNTLGTLVLLELSRRYDVERFIYTSSAAVYGNPIYTPIDEKHPCNPISMYGLSKYNSELLILNYHRNYGLKYSILRLFNVYGPRMRDGVIYHFIKNMLLNKEVVIYGDGEQTRDFVFVEDVVEAIYRAIINVENDVYNIGSGVGTSINELFNTLRSVLGSSTKPVYKPQRPEDIRHSVADISKAVNKLKWIPRVDLSKGLEKTVEFFKQASLEYF